MEIVEIYGTYYGQERLAWVGFADRVQHDFKETALGFLARKTRSEPGWELNYIPVLAARP
jgi:hypothetical protein